MRRIDALDQEDFEEAIKILTDAGIPAAVARDALSRVEEYAGEDAVLPYAREQAKKTPGTRPATE